MQNKISFLSILILFTTIFACSQKKNFHSMLNDLYDGTVPLIHAKQLYQKIQNNNNNIVLLDIREKKEYDVSHLKGANLLVYSKFEKKNIKSIPKNRIIVVYCSLGARSENIGEKFLDSGYQKVYNLYGGIFNWINQGYPVYNNKGNKTNKVHPYSKKWGIWLKKGKKVYK